VTVEGDIVGEIGSGLLVLLGVSKTDNEAAGDYLVEKVIGLRIFEDAEGKMNLSVQDCGNSLLVVSQFTLYADTRKGRRPSFIDAAMPEVAAPLVEHFVTMLRTHGVPTQTGQFGAHMQVEIHNDGPVTIWLEK